MNKLSLTTFYAALLILSGCSDSNKNENTVHPVLSEATQTPLETTVDEFDDVPKETVQEEIVEEEEPEPSSEPSKDEEIVQEPEVAPVEETIIIVEEEIVEFPIVESTNDSLNTPSDFPQNNLPIAFDYVNFWRTNAGMPALAYNEKLSFSSQNHTNYLVGKNIAHEEELISDPFYTGEYALNRAIYVEYGHKGVGENIAYTPTELSSARNLMTAIYHRFGFYSFTSDEMGQYGTFDTTVASGNNIFVYNLGNSAFREECANSTYSNETSVYFDYCQDPEQYIAVDTFNAIESAQIAKSAQLIIYPYPNAIDVPPAFFEEIPDPLGSYSMSGNPISYQFNPNIIDDISVLSFSLKKEGTQEELAYITLNENNDPNSNLTDKQFVYFPQDRLDYATTYEISLVYKRSGLASSKTVTSRFTTDALDARVIEIDERVATVNISTGEEVVFYFTADKNFPQNMGVSGYGYLLSSEASLNVETIDAVTYKLKLEGNAESFEFTLNSALGDIVVNVNVE